MDYRKLNKWTIKNHYSQPKIDDLMDQLNEALIFLKIGLKSIYHQLKEKASDTFEGNI